jgi:hypothetical protein
MTAVTSEIDPLLLSRWAEVRKLEALDTNKTKLPAFKFISEYFPQSQHYIPWMLLFKQINRL